MRIDAITKPEEWAALAEDWNALLAASHADAPFLRYEFQRAWWAHKGGGEWPDGQLSILTGRGEDGALLGIAPLFQAADPDGREILMFIGSHEIADFLDVIARPEDHAAFLAAVLDHWQAAGPQPPLVLYNLLNDSPTLAVLKELSAARNLDFDKLTLQPSPYVPVPESFEAYSASLDGKQAHELRRKLRRAARHPVPIELELVTGGSGLDAALQDFFRLMRFEADKASFLNAAMQPQMEAIARAAFEAGWGQLAFLRVGDARAAAYLNFDYGNRIWAYNAAFDPAFEQLSPGWLLIAEMMEWCIQQGREEFDFMRGAEDYKYRFGGIDRFVLQATLNSR
jgi:CelD/BcsL family acetyltransferase involved in cellulose biosynthesis